MKPKAFEIVYEGNGAKIIAGYIPHPEKEKIYKHDHYFLSFKKPKSRGSTIYFRYDEALGVMVVLSKLLWEYTEPIDKKEN